MELLFVVALIVSFGWAVLVSVLFPLPIALLLSIGGTLAIVATARFVSKEF